MKQVEISASIVDLLISSEQSQVRSAGIHVSSVIKHMRTVMGSTGGWPDEELNNAGQIGRIWEHVLARELAAAGLGGQHVVRPGEIECEGIIGSPDGVDCADETVIEMKATWQSSRKDIVTEFPWWQYQIKSYCHMLGWTRARLYVLFVNGNYKPPMPCVKAWEFQYSAGEIKSNWEMMLRQAKDMTNAAI